MFLTLKDVLRQLIKMKNIEKKFQIDSREFAKDFFDVNKNIHPLISLLNQSSIF